MAKEDGAMYALVHEKANTVNAVKQMTEELVGTLEKIEKGDDEKLEVALSVLQRRKAKMGEVDSLSRRIAFLEESGYTPGAEEKRRIELEQSAIKALFAGVQRADEIAAQKTAAIHESLMEDMKEVKDGQKSIQAYAGPPEEEEGRQVDTRT